MCVAPDGTWLVLPLFKHSNLICDGADSQFADPQAQVEDRRERERRKKVAKRGHYKTNLLPVGWSQTATGDEIGVDDRVEVMVVNGVIDM